MTPRLHIGVLLHVLCTALLLLMPVQAAAQAIDYNQLFSTAPESSEAEPQQSRPLRGFRSSDGPSADDYARLAGDTDPDRGSSMALSIDEFEDSLAVFQGRASRIALRVPDALFEVASTIRAASPTGRPSYFVGIAVFAGLLLVVGRAVAELYLTFVARPIFVRMQRRYPEGIGEKLPALVARFLLGVVSLVITVAVAVGLGLFFYYGHKPTLHTVVVVFGTYAASTAMHGFWRCVLCPFLANYRLPAIDDRQARRLYLWLTAASALGILSASFTYWVEALGLPREVTIVVTVLSTMFALATLGAALMLNRRTITAVLVGGLRDADAAVAMPGRDGEVERRVTWLQSIIALAWTPVALFYLTLTWVDLVFRLVMGIDAGAERIIAPFIVLVAAMGVYATVLFVSDRVLARGRRLRAINAAAAARAAAEQRPQAVPLLEAGKGPYPRTDGEGTTVEFEADEDESIPGGPGVGASASAATPAMNGRGMQTFEDLANRVASLLALGVAAYLVVWYWGGSVMFAESALFGVAEDIIDVLFIGYVVFHAARIALDQKIREEVGEDDPNAAIMDGEGGGAGATRLATLLPLVRNFILTLIAVTATLVVAIEMGVNVAPLFAGAGIVGLAIGFGAQTLVRDIISGAFFLLDDAFRKGEYIDVGSVKGTVEKISIRSFQLRHHLGMLHTIPFGEVQFLTNFSRDWVMMKLPLRLTYDTDVEKVRKLVKKLGQQLLEDPTVGHLFLQPLKSQGVVQMEDSAMIVRVKFMTKPGDQWVTRKRVYAELRELFDREGIKFAHREVTVRIPEIEGKDLSEDQKSAVGAATRANLDVIEAQIRPTGTGPIDDR